MAGQTRMGYESCQLFYGVAGSTASTAITNCVDAEYAKDPERGETTIKGDGTAVPIVTTKVTAIKPTITWRMLNKPSDTTLTALLAAAATGAAVAMRTKSYASGLGFDGDVNLAVRDGAPLKGEATFEFTAEATDDEGRSPSLWI